MVCGYVLDLQHAGHDVFVGIARSAETAVLLGVDLRHDFNDFARRHGRKAVYFQYRQKCFVEFSRRHGARRQYRYLAFYTGVNNKVLAGYFAYRGHQGGNIRLFKVKRKFFISLCRNQRVLRRCQWQCADQAGSKQGDGKAGFECH